MICSYLELMGTSVGTWAWAPHDASGLLGVGNPPSGIPGAYCFFDAAALAGFGLLLATASAHGCARSRCALARASLACGGDRAMIAHARVHARPVTERDLVNSPAAAPASST